MNDFKGAQNPTSSTSDLNLTLFLARQVLNRANTATLVKVVSCTNSGGLEPVGFVDVQPLVNQVDGAGNAMPHGVLHRLPYFRAQGGSNAIILDPQAGNIGIAVFADHDISSVAANKGQANPGSARRFDMADGLYIGGVLNGIPTQYVQFSTSGIKLSSPTKIELSAPDIQLDATTIEMNATGAIALTSTSLTHNGKNIGSTHTHGGVTTGGGNTAVPN